MDGDDGCVLLCAAAMVGFSIGGWIAYEGGRSKMRVNQLEPALRALGPEHVMVREYASTDDASEGFRRWAQGLEQPKGASDAD